jgi:hypothetical protein
VAPEVGIAKVASKALDNVDCCPVEGRALLFEHRIMHEGTCVNKGVKYTIRTDIEYGPRTFLAQLQEAVMLGGPTVRLSSIWRCLVSSDLALAWLVTVIGAITFSFAIAILRGSSL